MTTTIIVRDNVSLLGVSAPIFFALGVARLEYEKAGIEVMYINSASEPTSRSHMKTSLHWSGNAVDVSTHNMAEGVELDIVLAIRIALGSEFDVILGNRKQYIHMEYQPKRRP